MRSELLARAGVRAAGLSLLLAVTGLGAACGAETASPPGHHSVARPCTSQIRQLERNSSVTAETSTTRGIVPTSARLLQSRVLVTPAARGPECSILEPGKTVVLAVGHRLVFVANGPPSVDGPRTVLEISTSKGPSAVGPGAMGPTRHVIVTLVAVHAGTAGVTWIDCSGTAC